MTNSNAPFSNLSGKVLRRSRHQRMLSGVSGGIAEYLNIDATLVRLGWVVLTIITGGTGLLGYIVAWVVIPEADAAGPHQNHQQHFHTDHQSPHQTPHQPQYQAPTQGDESDIAARIYDDPKPSA